MKSSIETPRLLLRPLEDGDVAGMFALDSNPKVHQFLGNTPVTDLTQSQEWIDNIKQQYVDNGIGRWAVIEKSTGDFVGWAGLKLERNVNGRETFYDLGYRFREEFWGKGYATEASKAWVDFGFNEMKLPLINAYVDADHTASRTVLEKCGLKHTETFPYEGVEECWYELRNPNTTHSQP